MSTVEIEFMTDHTNGWRAADLMPKDACLIAKELYIKIGAGKCNDVQLHVNDPHRMTPGVEGVQKKKHFFFHVDSASIVGIPGDTPVVPHRVRVQVLERVTFLPHGPVEDPAPTIELTDTETVGYTP